MDKFFPLLIVVGLGGVVLYLLTRKPALPPVVDKTNMCGASYAGVGANIPCEYIGAGIKALGQGANQVVQSVGGEVHTAISGVKPVEVILTPIAISHVAYNETKRVLSWANPF